jgi:hypothetical protein
MVAEIRYLRSVKFLEQCEHMKSGDRVLVKLTKRQWDLILENAYIEPEVDDQIRAACIGDEAPTIALTRDDLDSLIGWMAGATNHAHSRKLMLELNQICDLLEKFQDAYDGKIIIIDDPKTFFR